MSQVTATSSVPVVQENGDFKVINKSVIILRRFLRNKAAVFEYIRVHRHGSVQYVR